jgi:hypothetical protein
MQEEVLEDLAIATQFVAHASYAGTARQAIADGYSAVDAAFSALLLNGEVDPPRNHKAKLDRVRSRFANLLDGYTEPLKNGARIVGGIAWDDVEEFYRQWLQARYEKFEATPFMARTRVSEAKRVVDFAIRAVASANGVALADVKAEVDARAFGSSDCPLYEALSMAHDHLFDQAERLGEEAGSKLGTKMAAATNFSSLDLVAGDELTREIIKTDADIARECGRLHVQLCTMIEMLRYKRQEALERDYASGPLESTNESTNFMFALRFRYHGEKLSETGERLGQSLSLVFRPTK